MLSSFIAGSDTTGVTMNQTPPDADATIIRPSLKNSGEAPAPTPNRTPLRGLLRGVSGEIFGKQYQVRDKTLIGRDAYCDIVLPYPEVSRHHVRLDAAADGVRLYDLGSSNGTFVNGQQVREALLSNGDEIAIHVARFRFEVPGALPDPRSALNASQTPARQGTPVWLWGVAAGAVVALIVAGVAFSLG